MHYKCAVLLLLLNGLHVPVLLLLPPLLRPIATHHRGLVLVNTWELLVIAWELVLSVQELAAAAQHSF